MKPYQKYAYKTIVNGVFVTIKWSNAYLYYITKIATNGKKALTIKPG